MKTAQPKKYSAYSLLELLLVLAMLGIFGAMAFGTFNGLENTVKMNEYMLSLEQDIRTTQRSAMLLERGTDERWLYGIGIDFSQMTDENNYGTYKKFKWCSEFNDYGNIITKSDFPNYDPETDVNVLRGIDNVVNAGLSQGYISSCTTSDIPEPGLITLSGEANSSVSVPKSTITLAQTPGGDEIRYIVFESVSGKAFLYDQDGYLVNYDSGGNPEEPTHFSITIDPQGSGKTRVLTVDNLSGRIKSIIQD